MHYSLPQNMVNTVRAWPEYNELLEILREKVVDVDRIFELLRKLSMRGNVFNEWKYNRYSLCFVLTCIKFHDAEEHTDQIFQLTLITFHMEGNRSSITCSTMPVKYQST
jgi:hypothetical protein